VLYRPTILTTNELKSKTPSVPTPPYSLKNDNESSLIKANKEEENIEEENIEDNAIQLTSLTSSLSSYNIFKSLIPANSTIQPSTNTTTTSKEKIKNWCR
jgi:hypothetical protein